MRATVTTTASVIAENTRDAPATDDWGTRAFLLKNKTATASVFLEVGAVATLASGFEWEITDGPLEIELEPGEQLSAIVAAGTQEIHILRSGR